MAKMRVLLAYSGGLDTSIIVPWLKENYDCDVVCVAGDVGQGEELEPLHEKAKKCGAEKLYIACDADPAVLAPIEALAREENIEIDERATMAQLGHSAGIAVGAAVIAVLRN